jgi:hypothetical protein
MHAGDPGRRWDGQPSSSGEWQVPLSKLNSVTTVPSGKTVTCAVTRTVSTTPPDGPRMLKCSVSVNWNPLLAVALPPNQAAAARR